MEIVVKKSALIDAMRQRLAEDTGEASTDTDQIIHGAFTDNSPVEVTPQMSTQLSADMPDVGDPDFMPVNVNELSRSAYVIAGETPDSQIEWFYRKLHEMLDDALDRDGSGEDLQESIRRVISAISESNGDDDENLIQGTFESAYQEFFEKINEDQELIPRVGRMLLVILERYITNLKHEDAEMASMELEVYGELITMLQKRFGNVSNQEPDIYKFTKGPEGLKEGSIRNIISLLIESEDDDDDDDFDYSGLESVGKINVRDIVSYMADKEYYMIDLVDPDTGVAATRPAVQADPVSGAPALRSAPMRVVAQKAEARDIVIAKLSEDPKLLRMAKEYLEQENKSVKSSAARNKLIDDIALEFEKYLIDPQGGAFDPAQIAINQSLSPKLDVMLKNMSYDDIISHYEKQLQDETIDPLLAQGYRDMISIIQTRKYDPDKRERTDLSVKMSRLKAADAPSEGEESLYPSGMSEEDRLRTLDSLAPLFGFNNANGLRQWRMKFPETIFKVVGGGTGGMDAFRKFSDQVYDYLSALLDNLSEIVAVLVEDLEEEAEQNPDDTDSAKVLELLQQVDIDLQELKDKRASDENENLDLDMLLNTLGGKVLRQVFSMSFYRPQFIDYARNMKKHMTKFLIDQGINTKTAGTFAKMFNGEVELRRFDSQERQMQKIKSGGLTVEIYRLALIEAEKFNKTFFGGTRLKELRNKYMEFMRNPEKLVKAIFEAIPAVAEWIKTEEEYPQLQVPDEGQISESIVRRIISGMV